MPLLTLPAATTAQQTFPIGSALAARFTVEFSPTTYATQTPVWVDITDEVMSIDIDRGRQRLLDRFEAGTASIVLKNADRRFDPSYSAGPYAGKLLPMVPFRVRMQYGNASYTRFVGFVDGWQQRYDRSNRFATAVVQLTDAFKILALAKPPSPWALRIQSFGTSVSAWYRLSETETSTGLRDSSAYARDGVYQGTPTMNQTGLVTNDTNGAVTFNGSTAWAYSDAVPRLQATIYLEAWFKTTSATAQTIVAYGNPSTGNLHCSIELNASGNLVYRFASRSYNTVFSDTTTAAYNDGNVHHVALFMSETLTSSDLSLLGADPLAYNPNNGVGSVQGLTDSFGQRTNTIASTAYEVDGSTSVATTRSSAAITSYPATAGRLAIGSNFGTGQFFNGTLDEIVCYMDPGRVLSLDGNYETGATPYANQATGTRVTKVLDLLTWPSTERNVQTGNSTLQAASFDGSILDHLQDVALSEQGRFFVGNDGRVTFTARQSTLAAQAAVTFRDTTAGVQFSDLAFSYDDGLIRNSVTAQRKNGGQVTVQDATSVDRYFERSYSQSTLLYANDNQTRDFATWVVNRFKDPLLRVESMTVLPERNPTQLYPVVGQLDLGTVVTVVRTPQNVGTAISATVTIEGVTERITPDRYEVVYRIANADTSTYWILDDTTYSVLNSTTRLAF